MAARPLPSQCPTIGRRTTYPEQYDLYGIDGVKLGSYTLDAYGPSGGVNPPPPFLFFAKQESRVSFAGRLIQMNGASVHPDRLGSLGGFYPYGEARNPATNPAVFATYRRDTNNGEWDYAMNRYYSNAWGRFMMPDPYEAGNDLSGGTGSGDPRAPQTWNRYAYVSNDPINYADPSGLQSVNVAYGCEQTRQMVSAVGGSANSVVCPTIPTSPTFSVDVFALAPTTSPTPAPPPMYTAPQIWDIGDSLAQPMPTYTGPIPTAPTGPSGGGKSQPPPCQPEKGFGAGIVGGGSLFGGAGPNYGGAGVVSAGAGAFFGSGRANAGAFASAGAALTSRGRLGNYPANNTSIPNFSVGASGGVGAGVFLTNAASSGALFGPFTSFLISIGVLGVEIDYSGGIGILSVTFGKSTGAGISVLQTNTLYTSSAHCP